MRHEVQYILTEAEMLKLFQERLDIPMPKLLFYDDSRDICNVPYFFMSYLDGVPLCDDQMITAVATEAPMMRFKSWKWSSGDMWLV